MILTTSIFLVPFVWFHCILNRHPAAWIINDDNGKRAAYVCHACQVKIHPWLVWKKPEGKEVTKNDERNGRIRREQSPGDKIVG